MEDDLWCVLDAGDVDWHEIFGDLGPLDGSGAAGGDVKHLGPEPANGNGVAETKEGESRRCENCVVSKD